MNEMIERVAKAISERLDEEMAVRSHLAEALARIAIEAMREPTDAMCEAALDTGAVDNGVFHIHPDAIKTLMHAMIDAALK